ncbi:hypothetical protein ACFWIO_34975 [Streptomyces diastatochromogenes]|uniref:hypothetical protein n=1 Tax=Streptomyces diastatochromogenes TaxID=42236 RepID=UPI00364F1146
MDHDELYARTMTVLNRAMDGDVPGAATALIEIGENGDPFDVFGACCAFAEVGKAALTKIYGDKAPDLSRGDMWAMQMLKPGSTDPADTFAVRFIVAYANDDKEQAPALFRAALESSGDEYVSSVSALLATAVSLAHTALNKPAV